VFNIDPVQVLDGDGFDYQLRIAAARYYTDQKQKAEEEAARQAKR